MRRDGYRVKHVSFVVPVIINEYQCVFPDEKSVGKWRRRSREISRYTTHRGIIELVNIGSGNMQWRCWILGDLKNPTWTKTAIQRCVHVSSVRIWKLVSTYLRNIYVNLLDTVSRGTERIVSLDQVFECIMPLYWWGREIAIASYFYEASQK